MNEEYNMTPQEIVRLSEWLTAKGLTAKDIQDCIKYISNTDDTES